jgi:2-(1,2-epoxy-1,2-dihydrophenyl)acetyl-CoA isomerase
MAVSDYEHIIYEKKDHVATLAFSFSGKLNAMDSLMTRELMEVLPDVQNDTSVRVMLLTGAGRGFCSGADVREFRPDTHTERTAGKGEQRYYRQPMPSSPVPRFMHDTVRKPVVVAINGIAAGAGYGMAMAADIRIASTNASFSHVYLRRALIPSAELWWLQHIVGIGMARHLLFTNKDIDAEEALRIGLITQLSEPDKLMDEAWEIAAQIAAGPPVATQWAKVLMDKAMDLSYNDAQYLSGLARGLSQPSGEFSEGVRSFLEKRQPEFTAE